MTRLDLNEELKKKILPFCRLKYQDIWEDSKKGHKVGVLDASKAEDVLGIMGDQKTRLIMNDPPYNVVVGSSNTKNLFKKNIDEGGGL